MNAPPAAIPPVLNPALPPKKTLRLLFLTLFLRGRSARGLRKESAPKSVARKLFLVLLFYLLFGTFAMAFFHKPVFALAVYLHAMTFVFLGMFVASSAGEILFNKEEADILLHRPVTSRELLWAKIRVLVEVSLWLGGAFNLVGLFVGLAAPDGNWLFPLIHAISTTLEALFCTACVILAYQLCLRWFGRERLEGLMTTAQVIVAVAAVLAGQIVPRVMLQMNDLIRFSADRWWIGLLPPAWFAGLDDTLAGSRMGSSWILAALGIVATVVVIWLAFGRLAEDYEAGLQVLGETISRPKSRARRRIADRLVNAPPLSWWLRDSVSRASFLLVIAYLARDRDVKLRIYPGVAPMLIMPFIFLIQGNRGGGDFSLAFSGAFAGMVPVLALTLLQYSQQWQASDIFRAAPMPGPAPLCHGARRAVLCLIAFPLVIIFGFILWFAQHDFTKLLLLLPGIIVLPVFALVPALIGQGIPFSAPPEEAKSAARGLNFLWIMIVSMALSGISLWASHAGWFWWLVTGETVVCATLYVLLRLYLRNLRWPSME